MRILGRLLTALGIVGMGSVPNAPSYAQQASQQPTEVALASEQLTDIKACERALRENTIEALEEYLRLFPYGECRVLALNALQRFEPSGVPETGAGHEPPSRPGNQYDS